MSWFKINSSWEMYGSEFIEAESLEKAIEIAESDDHALPDNSSYVQGSFSVDREVTYADNEIESP